MEGEALENLAPTQFTCFIVESINSASMMMMTEHLAELGPGEMKTGVDEGIGWWSSCRNAKEQRLELMSETVCDMQWKCIANGRLGCGKTS